MAEMITLNGMDTLNQTVLEYSGVVLTDDEFSLITHAVSLSDNSERTLRTYIGNVLSARAKIGWTTPGHTGVDVNLYSYGLRPSGLHGVKQNIDVGMELWKEIEAKLKQNIKKLINDDPDFEKILDKIAANKMSPYKYASKLINAQKV